MQFGQYGSIAVAVPKGREVQRLKSAKKKSSLEAVRETPESASGVAKGDKICCTYILAL